MIFNSLTFIVFFAVVLALHYAPFFSWHQKKINLLIASLPVLRRVEPAVRDPAVDLDGGRLVGGAMDGPRQAPSARAARGC